MKAAHVVATLLSLSTLAAAWPGLDPQFDGVKAVEDVGAMLFKRATSTSSDSTTSGGTSTSSDSSQKSSATSQGSSSQTSSQTSSHTDGKSSTSGTKTTGKSNSGSAAATTAAPTGGIGNGNQSSATTQYDPRLPAGGVSMITPAIISGPQYYKIGDWVTFAWNYTSLSATPSAIDVLASCAANSATYTLTLNQSVSETGKILWDTGAYQSTATVPLLTNTYTLIIYAADSSISAVPKAGYLAAQQTFTFGMYTPQSYTPWTNFQCPTCNSAMTSVERQTWAFLGGMAVITVLSFTWFASGVFGLF